MFSHGTLHPATKFREEPQNSVKNLFNLSNEQLEFQITDRTFFTRFLGLH
jgi:hypothetical protein